MRREANKYIFAPEKKSRRRGHAFRNFVLIMLPLLIAACVIGNFIVSYQVKLEKKTLTILNLPEDLESYSILHISDLHGAEYGEHQKAIAAVLGTTRYSCAVITGDMRGEDGDLDALLDLIALLAKDKPIYYIAGDTDGSWLDDSAHGSLSVYRDWAVELQEAGVILLDRPVSETRGKGTIWFVPEELYTLDLDGMETVYRKQLDELNRNATSLTADDAARKRVIEYETERIAAIRESKALFKADDIQIVLTHSPLTEEYVSDMIAWTDKDAYFSMRYAGLILAGHYNGGQWRLPGIGAIHVPELGWFPDDRLVQGWDYLNGIPQHISPGLGSDPHYEHQPGRFFNTPSLTLITLSRRGG